MNTAAHRLIRAVPWARSLSTRIPKDHPRRASLLTRERMREALLQGLVHETGLIAQGRGEAFDYLIGERTTPSARRAARAAARALKNAKRPVVSVNGNVVALAAAESVRVARAAKARLEVNLFHRTEERVARLVKELEAAGGKDVLGPDPDARIPDLTSDRALCHKEGIYGADVVLVPLEDGDRAEALKRMGKTVIAIDLNPLSRTARVADITIVDEVRRALANVAAELGKTKAGGPRSFDNAANLKAALGEIQKHLAREARKATLQPKRPST